MKAIVLCTLNRRVNRYSKVPPTRIECHCVVLVMTGMLLLS